LVKNVFPHQRGEAKRAGLLVLTMSLLNYSVTCLAVGGDSTRKEAAAGQVFGLNKVWSMHLILQPDQWEKMQPKRGQGGFGFPPAPAPRENTKAEKPAEPERDAKKRGMFGFDFPYVNGDLEIEDQKFKAVGVRYKGKGTYMSAQGLRWGRSECLVLRTRWRTRAFVSPSATAIA
jgi:hypothetical protein